ncbi:hypothetical protein LTS15_000155 [Exophiala xenobiotica]|nr:hypothetical protein LTS15_000155 [Exophiala xenobiotica]
MLLQDLAHIASIRGEGNAMQKNRFIFLLGVVFIQTKQRGGSALAESSQAFATLLDGLGDRFDTLQPEFYNSLNLEFLNHNMNIRTLIYLGFAPPLDDFTTITYTTGAPNETIYGEHDVAQDFFSIVSSGVLILQNTQPRWHSQHYDRRSSLRLLNRLTKRGHTNDVFRRPTFLDGFKRRLSGNFVARLHLSIVRSLITNMPAYFMSLWTIVSVINIDIFISVSVSEVKLSTHCLSLTTF